MGRIYVYTSKDLGRNEKHGSMGVKEENGEKDGV
jgi:hypothetical protein